jgi:hypothetical protein
MRARCGPASEHSHGDQPTAPTGILLPTCEELLSPRQGSPAVRDNGETAAPCRAEVPTRRVVSEAQMRLLDRGAYLSAGMSVSQTPSASTRYHRPMVGPGLGRIGPGTLAADLSVLPRPHRALTIVSCHEVANVTPHLSDNHGDRPRDQRADVMVVTVYVVPTIQPNIGGRHTSTSIGLSPNPGSRSARGQDGHVEC